MSTCERDRADIAVAGFGPVGAACAIALAMRRDAKRVLVLDGRPVHATGPDARMIAISEGSRILLERVGAWQDHDADPIEEIHVSQRGHFGRTLISARDYGLPALGYVIAYGALESMLQRRARALGVEVVQARVERVEHGSAALALKLSDDTRREAAYLVHAEGGTFADQHEKTVSRSYDQVAISAIVSASHPIARRAFERFTTDGPIALLPCRYLEQQSYALVWCQAPEDSERRLELSDHAFLDQLHQAFGRRLGRFDKVGARARFPLGLNLARQWPHAREPAIGNAAQTLHPVAGQGFNLGLRDAMVLSETMTRWFHDAAHLEASFRAERKLDRSATVGLTDLMPRAFALPYPLAASIRGGALALLDLVPGLRHPLARQMMNGQR